MSNVTPIPGPEIITELVNGYGRRVRIGDRLTHYNGWAGRVIAFNPTHFRPHRTTPVLVRVQPDDIAELPKHMVWALRPDRVESHGHPEYCVPRDQGLAMGQFTELCLRRFAFFTPEGRLDGIGKGDDEFEAHSDIARTRGKPAPDMFTTLATPMLEVSDHFAELLILWAARGHKPEEDPRKTHPGENIEGDGQ